MATHAGNMFRDQNLNVHFNGVPIGGKTNTSTVQKKGGLGGRKALNDISNSGKPSMLQASKKHNLKNVIPFEEDIGVSKPLSVVGKTNASKVAERKPVGGRKALGDLTNSVKPHYHEQKAAPKKSQNKLSAVAEENFVPNAIAEERFLHNHQECIKAQRKAVDMDYFMKTVGLDFSVQSASTPGPPLSRKMKPESTPRNLEMEEMSELLIEDQSFRSPYGSPKSPKSSCLPLEEYYNNFPNFILMQSP